MVSIENKNYLFTNKNLMKLILPLMVEQLLIMTVGLAGSIMVASVGESAVSAVSLVDSVIILLINIFAALATGGAVVAGQFIGQKKYSDACKAGEQLVVFSTFISIIIMIIMYLGRGFILNVVFGDIEQVVYNYANTYLLITFASIPFIALYNSGAALFRTMGNSKITMVISLIMNLINIIGNALFVYVFHQGVLGVAISALVSRMISSLIIITLLRNKGLIIHLSKPFSYKFDGIMVKKILHIGVPNGIENSMFQLGKILLLSIVAEFGTASITANAVSNTICNFQILPGIAIGLGLVTVISQCVGAGDYEQVRYYTKKLIKYAYISMFSINIVIMLVLPFVLNIYNLSEETAAMVRQVLIFHSVNSIISWPLAFTLPNTLRASNDVRYTMIVGVFSMWIFRIGFGILIAKYLNYGMFGTWVAMIIDWIIRSTLFIIRYRGHKWEIKNN
ncbi:MAG: efflux family protein [Bacillota bacterium]|nr:efflux family protein [Bacillota bacterium]